MIFKFFTIKLIKFALLDVISLFISAKVFPPATALPSPPYVPPPPEPLWSSTAAPVPSSSGDGAPIKQFGVKRDSKVYYIEQEASKCYLKVMPKRK